MNGSAEKVVFVTHYTNLYGANLSLLCLIKGLREYGVKSCVLAPSTGDLTEELSRREIPFFVAPFRNWMSRTSWKAPGRLFLTVSVLPYLARKVYKWGGDHVHSNSSVTPMGALLSEALSLTHTWHIREFGNRDFNLEHDWGKSVFQSILNRANAAIAVSESVRNHVLSGVNIPTHVVYNGVISRRRVEEIKNESSFEEEGPFTFSLVGRISPAKGQKQAVRALGELKEEVENVRLLIAGSGDPDYVSSVEALVADLNLERDVSFLGYVTDPYKVYEQSDAVLMCSPHEAMGRVTAEAMAAVCPVIGFDNDATSELIDHRRNGLLYDGSDRGLYEAMRYLSYNRKKAWKMGERGWEEARKKFTMEMYSKKIYKIIKRYQ